MEEIEELIRLSYFSEIAKAIVSETSVKGILNKLMAKIGDVFAPLNWSTLLLDRKNDQLEFRVVVGKASEKLLGQRIPAFEGVAGWVVAHGTEVIVEDVSQDSRFSDRIDSISGFTTSSIIAVPLKTEDKVFGVIELINKLDGGRFSALEMRTLATIADFAAIAIEKAVYLAQIKRMAMTDAMTGLLNRRGLARILERENSRIKRHGGEVAFILADVDQFKEINDNRGHAAGDVVLKCVAEALQKVCRESDAVARFGGDEFLVVMPDTNPEAAALARDRIAAGISRAAQKCPAGAFTVSLGVHAGKGSDINKIFEESDRDMYRRKEERNPNTFGEKIMSILDDDVQTDASPGL